MPHRYSRSTRSASHTRKINPTLARLRTSSSTTLIGARRKPANACMDGLRATSSAVVRAGHSGDGGGGRLGCKRDSADDESAVDDDRLAGHVVAVAAGEKRDDACNVVGFFGTAQGNKRRASPPGFT